MRLQSGQYRRRGESAATVLALAAAVLLLPAVDAGPAHAAGAQDAAEVAYVEDVSGRVVAFANGKPTLLDALDIISDRTRLDLQANSELRLCHYQTLQLLTLKGPLRVDVNEQNPEALGFYLANGFEVTGRSPLDGQGRPFPLLHLAERAAASNV